MLARDRGEVLFLTGAGVSTPPPSSLPNFRGLVVQITQALDTVLSSAMLAYSKAADKAADADKLTPKWAQFASDLNQRQQTALKRFAAGEYDVVLGMLERNAAGPALGPTSMRLAAAQVLDAAKKTNALHKSLNKLARRFEQTFVATTNFDRLHEKAAAKSNSRSYGLLSLPRPSRRRDFAGIFHIHGALPTKQGGPIEIVLTDQDFGDVYMRRRIASDFIYDAVRIFHLVIIGYSMNDAPLRYLLNAVAGDDVHFPDLKARYAIVPRNGDDQTVAMDWKTRSIEPILYDAANDHSQLVQLLAAWADSVPKPGKPDRWAKTHLKAICAKPVGDTMPEERSIFEYIIRRSSRGERLKYVEHLAKSTAHPDWLSQVIRITREIAS